MNPDTLPSQYARRRCLALLGCLLISGCYLGTARHTTLTALKGEDGWDLVEGVSFVHQATQEDCGAAAISMVLSYWGLSVKTDDLPSTPTQGIKAAELRDLARRQGLHAFVIEGQLSDLSYELQRRRPVIVGLIKRYLLKVYSHYEVVIGINRNQQRIITLDPAHGLRVNSFAGFSSEWAAANRIALAVFP